MKTLVRALACTGVLMASTAVAAHAEAPSDASRMFDTTTLTLSAAGEVQATPDKASINLGVQVKAPTAAEAMAQNARRMNAVIAELRRAGVPEKDVQTSNLSLSAQYIYVQNQEPKPDGYQAADTVTVTVNDLSKLGSVIDAVTAAGANQIDGINFGLKNPQANEDQARLEAVKTLRARADLYAQASGYHLGRLISLSEDGGAAPQPPRPMMMMAMAKSADATPVSPGELTLRVNVSALYELTR